jgi:hypothetical protein
MDRDAGQTGAGGDVMGETQTMLFGATEANPSEFACTSSKSVQRRLASQITKPSCEEEGTGLRAPASPHDPLSSRISADQVEKSGLRRHQIEKVVNALRLHPDTTTMELSHRSGLDRYMIARRMSEAESLNLVVRGEKMKTCSISKKLAQTWSVKE